MDLIDFLDYPVPFIPADAVVELFISLNEDEFLSGKDGVVWATFDSRQAEVINDTLLVQHLNSEIKTIHVYDQVIYCTRIINDSEIEDAMDFIWRKKTGLRLIPDWNYPRGESNRSFEQWLSGQ